MSTPPDSVLENRVGNKLTNKLPSSFSNDLFASVVVFLVALPLCMGIAIASGVPASYGIITGIVGGILVGCISGAPLLVSGPAAGLAVMIWELINDHGLFVLGPIVFIAGAIQLAAGSLKMGQWFRAVSPSVIHGMLAGIGVSIVAAQLYLMMDLSPVGNGIRNLLHYPVELENLFIAIEAHQGSLLEPINGSTSHIALGIGLLTIAVAKGWDKLAPTNMKLLPSALIAVIVATLVSWGLDLPVAHVTVPENLFAEIAIPGTAYFATFKQGDVVLAAIAVAFIASAETLLSASAVDKMHDGTKTKYSKELFAQGAGNMVCGLLGALPMTGVIARSSANVQAGAKTRLSTIMHGCLMLVFATLLSFLLAEVPIASLSAILIIIGIKLINPAHIRKLKQFDKSEVWIYAITLGTIVVTDLLDGVLIGIGLAFARLLYSLLHLETKLEKSKENEKVITLHLMGAATFIQLPRLASTLEKIPFDTELHVDIQNLSYIDPACLELMEEWGDDHKAQGGTVVIEWHALFGKYKKRELTETSNN
ncbi:SulP family inorganic anion transporter [Thaumasiovibrio subtropicus]|uniref:SulP family inorganic anion transporter n=2 Tax=Thaumasiovibrio subtropicus TaxID=1891207 RepID=UPI001C841892|nr:SulP family inorganic anion transporter [Thaumasiovibrio subtropicus]